MSAPPEVVVESLEIEYSDIYENSDKSKDHEYNGEQVRKIGERNTTFNTLSTAISGPITLLDGQEIGVVKQGTTYSNYILYHIENEIAANPTFAFVLIAILFIFCYLVLGIIWYLIGKSESENFNNDDDNVVFGTTNLNDALYFSLQMLVAAGYDDSIPSGNGLRSVSFLMILTGLVVFAILVGFITDSVTTYMDSLKVGSTDVELENHTIILGWNEATARSLVQISFLRRQYQQACEKANPLLRYFPFLIMFWRPIKPSSSLAANDIVILCNSKSKEEMHTIIENSFSERGISQKRTCLGKNVVCRVGDPTDINDLLRIGLHKASAILVQVTENDKQEEEHSLGVVKNGITLRSAMAIRNAILSNIQNDQINTDLRIILQLSKPSTFVDAITMNHKSTNRDIIIPLEMSMFLNIWLFKCAIKPRLVQCLMDILNFEGMSLRRRKTENLRSGLHQKLGNCIGQTFEELQMEFVQAVLLGVVRPKRDTKKAMEDDDLGLLCDPKTVLQHGDLLIFLDETSSPVTTLEGVEEVLNDKKEAKEILKSFEASKVPLVPRLKTILICGWQSAWGIDSRRLKKRILETAQSCTKGSIFIFVNFVASERFNDLMQEINFPKSAKSLSEILAENNVAKGRAFQPTDKNPLEDYNSQIYEIESTGVYIQHIEGDAASRPLMERMLDAHQNMVDTAIIMGSQALDGNPTQLMNIPPHSQDTRVLCVVLLLRKLCMERAAYIHVVAENQEDVTAKLALPPRGTGVKPDFVNCQAIYARTIVQSLAYPLIQGAIKELFEESNNSCNLEKYEACNFVPLGRKLRFGVVQQLVLHQTTYPDMRFSCIGHILNNEEVILMPPDETIIEYTNDDFLIVFCRPIDRLSSPREN